MAILRLLVNLKTLFTFVWFRSTALALVTQQIRLFQLFSRDRPEGRVFAILVGVTLIQARRKIFDRLIKKWCVAPVRNSGGLVMLPVVPLEHDCALAVVARAGELTHRIGPTRVVFGLAYILHYATISLFVR
jgi:hypothetical protein